MWWKWHNTLVGATLRDGLTFLDIHTSLRLPGEFGSTGHLNSVSDRADQFSRSASCGLTSRVATEVGCWCQPLSLLVPAEEKQQHAEWTEKLLSSEYFTEIYIPNSPPSIQSFGEHIDNHPPLEADLIGILGMVATGSDVLLCNRRTIHQVRGKVWVWERDLVQVRRPPPGPPLYRREGPGKWQGPTPR